MQLKLQNLAHCLSSNILLIETKNMFNMPNTGHFKRISVSMHQIFVIEKSCELAFHFVKINMQSRLDVGEIMKIIAIHFDMMILKNQLIFEQKIKKSETFIPFKHQ